MQQRIEPGVARQFALAVAGRVRKERQAGNGAGAAINARPHCADLQRPVRRDVPRVWHQSERRHGILHAGVLRNRTTTKPTGKKTSHVGYNGYWFGKYSAAGELKPVDGKYVVYTTDSGKGKVVKSTYKRPAMPAKGLPN